MSTYSEDNVDSDDLASLKDDVEKRRKKRKDSQERGQSEERGRNLNAA